MGAAPAEAEDLLRGAKVLGLKARVVRLDAKRAVTVPKPALVETMDGGFLVLTAQLADGRFRLVDATTRSVSNVSADGGAGSDKLLGEDGDDWIAPGAGADQVDGGLGDDWVDYESATSGVRVDFSNVATNTGDAAGDTYVSIEISMARTLPIRSSVTTRLCGSIWGFEGNDTIVGGAGVDNLYGDVGNDSIAGGAGDDWLIGGLGADALDGGAGIDGASYVHATAAVRVDLTNSATNTGEATGDSFSSIEKLHGSTFADTLVGSATSKTIWGDSGDDTILGGSADEQLLGDGGNDTVAGGAGNDWLYGGAGADSLDGGSGTDGVSYISGTAAVTVSLVNAGANTGEALGDTFTSIEQIQGSTFSDVLVGNASATNIWASDGNDSVTGGTGNDSLYGENGDDFLSGGAGADNLDGGAGIDTVSYYSASAGVRVDLTNVASNTGHAAGDTYSGIEKFNGSLFADTFIASSTGAIFFADGGDDTLTGGSAGGELHGEAGNDTLNGNDGDDTLYGDAGADQLNGGNGFDSVSYKYATAGVRVDLDTPATNTGDAAGDTFGSIERVVGSSYGETLIAASTATTIYAGAGDDTITGKAGLDTLSGESGNDSISGFDGATSSTAASGPTF